jgi:hypothetical protein
LLGLAVKGLSAAATFPGFDGNNFSLLHGPLFTTWRGSGTPI